ncbi:uncharacterized protein DUF4336 [Breoghania corrubedonensis]|uniref:Uncharacterized protein DUF4336 n=1 Tax=Breoghania corrubedonensis TaxID=665038 RepID=A0A2T5VCN1_9HYPH|nr:DUF4336 domain-containing protein [Breoghania corrubedonensis]PTW61519.1 uncharacterized protein DUF4336 [Breoghania corrubedonensis]
MTSSPTYPPLNRLKPVAENIWIVDGPTIRFGLPWPKLTFPTRMTVIRLDSGDLMVHSPTPLTPKLRSELDGLGPVRHLIGPNRIHYWWLPDWKVAFPEADVWLAPRIREQAGTRIDFVAFEIENESGYPWDSEVETILAAGAFMTEVDFFHRKSRTLVLTDLIENFEPEKVAPWPMRILYRLGGVLHPHGSMPRDMRRTYRGSQEKLKAAVERMIAFDPERVILAHGRWYERDGAAELRRAFAWLLE